MKFQILSNCRNSPEYDMYGFARHTPSKDGDLLSVRASEMQRKSEELNTNIKVSFSNFFIFIYILMNLFILLIFYLYLFPFNPLSSWALIWAGSPHQ